MSSLRSVNLANNRIEQLDVGNILRQHQIVRYPTVMLPLLAAKADTTPQSVNLSNNLISALVVKFNLSTRQYSHDNRLSLEGNRLENPPQVVLDRFTKIEG